MDTEALSSLIQLVAKVIEVAAVVVIVASMVYSALRMLRNSQTNMTSSARYSTFRASLGRGLLVGLEVLVAADIIRTIALEPSLQSVVALGVLVLVRVVLGWSITVEIEGRWPWQPARDVDDRQV